MSLPAHRKTALSHSYPARHPKSLPSSKSHFPAKNLPRCSPINPAGPVRSQPPEIACESHQRCPNPRVAPHSSGQVSQSRLQLHPLRSATRDSAPPHPRPQPPAAVPPLAPVASQRPSPTPRAPTFSYGHSSPSQHPHASVPRANLAHPLLRFLTTPIR